MSPRGCYGTGYNLSAASARFQGRLSGNNSGTSSGLSVDPSPVRCPRREARALRPGARHRVHTCTASTPWTALPGRRLPGRRYSSLSTRRRLRGALCPPGSRVQPPVAVDGPGAVRQGVGGARHAARTARNCASATAYPSRNSCELDRSDSTGYEASCRAGDGGPAAHGLRAGRASDRCTPGPHPA